MQQFSIVKIRLSNKQPESLRLTAIKGLLLMWLRYSDTGWASLHICSSTTCWLEHQEQPGSFHVSVIFSCYHSNAVLVRKRKLTHASCFKPQLASHLLKRPKQVTQPILSQNGRCGKVVQQSIWIQWGMWSHFCNYLSFPSWPWLYTPFPNVKYTHSHPKALQNPNQV